MSLNRTSFSDLDDIIEKAIQKDFLNGEKHLSDMLEIFLLIHDRFKNPNSYEDYNLSVGMSVCDSNYSKDLREYAESMHHLIEKTVNKGCTTADEKCLFLDSLSEMFEKIFFQKIDEWELKRRK